MSNSNIIDFSSERKRRRLRGSVSNLSADLSAEENINYKEFTIHPRLAPPRRECLHVEDYLKGIGMVNSLYTLRFLASSKVFVCRVNFSAPKFSLHELESSVNRQGFELSTVDDLFGLASIFESEDVFSLGRRIVALGTLVYDKDGAAFCPAFEKNEKSGILGLYMHCVEFTLDTDVMLFRVRYG